MNQLNWLKMAKNVEIVEILRVFDDFWFFEPVEAYKPVVNYEELRAWAVSSQPRKQPKNTVTTTRCITEFCRKVEKSF